MKLAMIVNPFTEHTLALAAQVGVQEIVLTYPGPGVAPLLAARRMVEAAGMRLAIVERKIPHLKMVHGLPGRDAEVENFRTLLRDMAEAGGVRLALHPDDPPLAEFNGQPQIITSNEALQRVVALAPSPANCICYCVGSLFPAGNDVVAGIQALGPQHIAFVHARNVRGTATHFTETWYDNGAIHMPAVFRALKEVGYTGSVRPDHDPSMAGETNETPGYEMLGRLFAAGYLRGLMQAL